MLHPFFRYNNRFDVCNHIYDTKWPVGFLWILKLLLLIIHIKQFTLNTSLDAEGRHLTARTCTLYVEKCAFVETTENITTLAIINFLKVREFCPSVEQGYLYGLFYFTPGRKPSSRYYFLNTIGTNKQKVWFDIGISMCCIEHLGLTFIADTLKAAPFSSLAPMNFVSDMLFSYTLTCGDKVLEFHSENPPRYQRLEQVRSANPLNLN